MLNQRLSRKLSKINVSQFISCKYHRNNKKQAKTEEVVINYKMFPKPVFIIQVDLYIKQPSPYKRNCRLFFSTVLFVGLFVLL